MLREIVLDTETTGLDPSSGDRIVEIGCVELIDYLPTGKTYHTHINPQRMMSDGASKVSGITDDMLRDKPIFSQIVDPFLEFIGESNLIIHNAAFDMKFINAELDRLCREPLPYTRAIDTIVLARKKFPGSPANLDALCRRFNIDLSARVKHGALLDAELLSKVYLELIGGRQVAFAFQAKSGQADLVSEAIEQVEKILRPSRGFKVSDEELAGHKTLIEGIKDPLWMKLA